MKVICSYKCTKDHTYTQSRNTCSQTHNVPEAHCNCTTKVKYSMSCLSLSTWHSSSSSVISVSCTADAQFSPMGLMLLASGAISLFSAVFHSYFLLVLCSSLANLSFPLPLCFILDSTMLSSVVFHPTGRKTRWSSIVA